MREDKIVVELPAPEQDGEMSLEQALLRRRSVREFSDAPVSLEQLAQLLWAAQGITSGDRLRTAPSAGALYPLEIFVAAGNVKGLGEGIYRYDPRAHSLILESTGDKRTELKSAALSQSPISDAPVVFVFAAVYTRITSKYGDRGIMYAHIEAGHAAQNLLLQCAALGLGAVPIGAFHDDRVKKVLGISEDPLYIIPAGGTDK
ncbi:SagB/ThcOx family dehydrogenase [bacterium]